MSTIPATNDIEATWAYLEDGVDHIMSKLDSGVSYSKYMSLYTVAYNYCTQTGSNRVSRPFGAGGSDLVASDLYSNLIKYFVGHLKEPREQAVNLQDTQLLQFYVKEWERFTIGANYVNRLFTYLNRQWVKRERDEGRKQILSVYTLALSQWKINLFLPVQKKDTRLATAVLQLIEMQRNGEVIDQSLVKKVVDSFVAIGLNESEPEDTCLDVYKEHFEDPFLEATETHYTRESETFLAENPVPEYLKKVEGRLRDEEDRVDQLLHTQTRKPLVLKCEEVLLKKHSAVLWQAFERLLDFDKTEDLRRMYVLLARMPDGLDPLRKRFEAHIRQKGAAAVDRVVGGGNPDAVDPSAYVEALLAVYRKGSDTVTRCFAEDFGFSASLDKACGGYMNLNAATGNSSSKSPELLAKHADLLLRKANKTADDEALENALNQLMIVFKYIDNKDVFQTFYSTRLSKRLIYGVSNSDEAEASMITKLKEACGFDYTTKLQRMFTDMSLSKDLTENFKEAMDRANVSSDLNLAVMILATNTWPLKPPEHQFSIPGEIRLTYDRFLKWYNQKHNGRKLTWLWNYSKNELRTNYLNQKYIFMASSFQTAILLQFNKEDSLSLSDLETATSLPKDYLKQILALLVRARVLVNEEDEQYDLNPGFKSKKIRINLNQPIKTEVKVEQEDVLISVDGDRKFAIQATIVRIMKARKTMRNQQLVQEIISQISQRFAPKLTDIKKEIDSLLEKEFIERLDGTKDTFSYVA